MQFDNAHAHIFKQAIVTQMMGLSMSRSLKCLIFDLLKQCEQSFFKYAKKVTSLDKEVFLWFPFLFNAYYI